MTTAVIADIVGSRRLNDRSQAQRALELSIAEVERAFPHASAALAPTVGDELQAVYRELPAALCATLLVQLSLPTGIELRFGIGVGETRTVESAAGSLDDGPAWWAARAAIDEVHRMQRRSVPGARCWIVGGAGEDGGMNGAIHTANAYLLARDQIIAAMTERTRRLTFGRCIGLTQRQLAENEGITQSAVSQALGAAGAAALVVGFETLAGSLRGSDA